MKNKVTGSSGRVIVARLFKGDDILESIEDLVVNHQIKGGAVSGIGAVEKATLKFFNVETNKYELHEIDDHMEVTSLIGNVAWRKDASEQSPIVHLHINLGKKDLNVIGGHLEKPTIVSATLEVYIYETDEKIYRSHDEATDLVLLDL
jgi:predicted DNA-binding protein with PD1-like motif